MLLSLLTVLFFSFCLCDSSFQFFVHPEYSKLEEKHKIKGLTFYSSSHASFAHVREERNYNQELKAGIFFDSASSDIQKNTEILQRLTKFTKQLHLQQTKPKETPQIGNTEAFATFYSDGANSIANENPITILYTPSIAILRVTADSVHHLELKGKELFQSPTIKHLQTNLEDGQYLVIIQYMGEDKIHYPFAKYSADPSDEDKSVKQAFSEPDFASKIIDWPTFRENHDKYLKTIARNLIYRLLGGNSADKRLKEMAVMVIVRVPYSPFSTFPLFWLLVMSFAFIGMVILFAFSNKSIN
jgi:hypothetical protein